MKNAPVILLSPSTQQAGKEFYDYSLSLSDAYPAAVLAVGGIPWIMPCTESREAIAESVRRSDGVLLSGGDDIEPGLYAKKLPPALAKTVGPRDPRRDLLELTLIDEVFRQGKPLFAICRGQQILNVALGGDLIVDIPQQVPKAIRHGRIDLKGEKVHEITVEKDSLLFQAISTDKVGVNSSHHQAVGRVAKLLRVVARSDDGIIEALELGLAERNLLPYLVAVQFHPERLYKRYTEFQNLFRGFVQACGRGT